MTEQQIDRASLRLPNNVSPTAYRLTIEPDLDAGAFAGQVAIDVELHETTTTIELHALDLDISAVHCTVDGGQVVAVTHEIHGDRLRLRPSDPGASFAAGTGCIEVEWTASLSDSLVGFYTSGEPAIGVTQFEAPHARRAFPCWDEPEYKATFEIDIICDASLLAVSGGRERTRETTPDGRTHYRFEPTMSMSTYLVAWVVGDLVATEGDSVGDVPIRVIHRAGQEHLTAFALDVAAHSIRWFEEYYGIAFPASKLDLVAVPDFAFGAMENTGCVTFRESLLMVNPATTSRIEQERAATVIAHEIAHMWFGNLVTMKWWNGIWLNEAFATFMEMSCANDYRDDWDIWTSFGLARAAAFDTDSLAATRPIEFEVHTPEDAEAMFDVLTYEKGAAVLRMFEQWVGPENFRHGVRRYLATYAHSNTDTGDLWQSLGEAIDLDLGPAMDSWILQGGHPILDVAMADDEIVITPTTRDAHTGPWHTPVTVATLDAERAEARVTELVTSAISIAPPQPIHWCTANAGGAGFYRCDYQGHLRGLHIAGLPLRPAVERLDGLDNAFAMFVEDRWSFDDLTNCVLAIARSESHPTVWRRLTDILSTLKGLAPETQADTMSDLAQECAVFARGAADSADEPVAAQLGAIADRLSAVLGSDTDTQARLLRSLDDVLDVDSPTDPELGGLILEVAVANGGEFDRVLHRFRNAPDVHAELRALRALGRTGDTELADSFFELCRTEVKTQNAPYALAEAMGTPGLARRYFDRIARHWDELCERYPSSSIVRMAGGIRHLTDPADAAAATEFFEHHDVPHGALTLQQHLQRMRSLAAVRARSWDG